MTLTELMTTIKSIPHVFKIYSLLNKRSEKKRQEQEKNKDALRALLTNKRRKASIAEVRAQMQKTFGPAACNVISSADIHFAQAQEDAFHCLDRRVASSNSVRCSSDGRAYSDHTKSCGVFGGPEKTLALSAAVFAMPCLSFLMSYQLTGSPLEGWGFSAFMAVGSAIILRILNNDINKIDAGEKFLRYCERECVVPEPYRPGIKSSSASYISISRTVIR
jgi:hypothetical protein